MAWLSGKSCGMCVTENGAVYWTAFWCRQSKSLQATGPHSGPIFGCQFCFLRNLLHAFWYRTLQLTGVRFSARAHGVRNGAGKWLLFRGRKMCRPTVGLHFFRPVFGLIDGPCFGACLCVGIGDSRAVGQRAHTASPGNLECLLSSKPFMV